MDENKPVPATPSYADLNPAGSEELGQIQINHTVIESIVRIAAKVDGVLTVGTHDEHQISGLFGKKDTGIQVQETPEGYQITIRVAMSFGVILAKVAEEIQRAVRDHVEKMTNNPVTKVNVIIDEVRWPDPDNSVDTRDPWNEHSSN